MTVWLAIYNLPSDNHVAYQRQRDEVKAAIQTYGVDHVGGGTLLSAAVTFSCSCTRVSDGRERVHP
jgi:hypothetical protein